MTTPPPVGSMAAAQANSQATGAASAPPGSPLAAIIQAQANASGSTTSPAAIRAATLKRYQDLTDSQKAQVWQYYIAVTPGSPQMPTNPGGLNAPPPGMADAQLDTGINMVVPFQAGDPTPAALSPDEQAAQARYQAINGPSTQADMGPQGVTYQADQMQVQMAIKTDAKSSPYMQSIVFYAGQLNIPWQVLWGVLEATSAFDPNFSSGTTHGIAGLPDSGDGTTHDPTQSIQQAASKLAGSYDKYHDWGLALMAYNQGDAAAEYMKQYGKPAAGTDQQALAFWAKATAKLPTLGLDMTGTAFTTTKSVLSQGPDQVKLVDQVSLKQTVQQKFQQLFFRQPTPGETQAFMDIVNQATVAGQTQQNNPYSAGGAGGGSTAPGASGTPAGTANDVLGYAKTLIGTPYLWGGTGTPAQGGRFDCSGMVQAVFAKFGVTTGRDTSAQIANRNAAPVSDISQAMPGDILFFGGTATHPDHEGIYLGNGQMIDSPHTGSTIGIHNIAGYGNVVGIRRFSVTASPQVAGTPPGAQVTTQPTSVDAALTQSMQGTQAYSQLYGQKQGSQTEAQYAANFQTAGKVGAQGASDQAISLGMQANNPTLTHTISEEDALSHNDPSAVGSLSQTALALAKLI